MGKIDFFLTRPFSYLKEIIFHDIAGKCFYLSLFLPLYLVLSWSVTQITQISFPVLSLPIILSFILLLFFAYIIELCIGISIVLLGFWFEGSQGLEHFKWISITLFSGSLIPLEFLPNWMQTISALLPLKYMYAVPLSILQGRTMLDFTDLLTMVVSILVFIFFLSFTWKKALLQYSSSGG